LISNDKGGGGKKSQHFGPFVGSQSPHGGTQKGNKYNLKRKRKPRGEDEKDSPAKKKNGTGEKKKKTLCFPIRWTRKKFFGVKGRRGGSIERGGKGEKKILGR